MIPRHQTRYEPGERTVGIEDGACAKSQHPQNSQNPLKMLIKRGADSPLAKIAKSGGGVDLPYLKINVVACVQREVLNFLWLEAARASPVTL